MSGRHTATIPSQAVAEWVRIFPKQATETYTSSETFMKQLTIVAVSTISYLKNAFPEDSYTVENFGGIRLKILKKKCNDDLAQFVSTGLAQAFEAFDKKYLHQLALCLHEDVCNADNLLEYHLFEYTYTPTGVTMGVTSRSRDQTIQTQSVSCTFDNLRHRTLQLIRSCVVIMETSPNPLPKSYDMSLRLYYNDDAPVGYQAPGFLSAAEVVDPLAGGSDATRVGVVGTPFHRVTLSSYMREALGSSHEAQASQNVPMMTQNETNDFNSADVSYAQSEGSTPGVHCDCGKTDRDDELMLTCEYCGTQQHAACFGRRARAAAAAHCCSRCFDADARRAPSDARLAQLSPKKRECLCILRRTLAWGVTLKEVGAAALVDKFCVTQVNAVKLVKLLQTNGVLEANEADILSPRRIVQPKLISMIRQYFPSEESALVGRLLAETLSQETRSDPVGDVLGPMEKVSLQNASAIGKIIEPPQQDSIMVDATLKQYKDVILSNQQTEEFPLSGNHNPIKDMENIGKKNGKRKAGKENARTGVKTKRAKTTLK